MSRSVLRPAWLGSLSLAAPSKCSLTNPNPKSFSFTTASASTTMTAGELLQQYRPTRNTATRNLVIPAAKNPRITTTGTLMAGETLHQHPLTNDTAVRNLVTPAYRSRRLKRVPPFSKGNRSKRSTGRTQPSITTAQTMPLSVQEMDNDSLVILGQLGDHKAHTEILKRHIMVQDGVPYEKACETFQTISKKNKEGQYLLALPYQIGIATALTAGFASFPLVFDLGTADWFNTNFVTTDVPEPADLETFLEVGAWTWNWMEPPLGQISFFLLCLQFSRSQLGNLGVKPYTKRVKKWRAEYLASIFPRYDSRVVMAYSQSSDLMEDD